MVKSRPSIKKTVVTRRSLMESRAQPGEGLKPLR